MKKKKIFIGSICALALVIIAASVVLSPKIAESNKFMDWINYIESVKNVNEQEVVEYFKTNSDYVYNTDAFSKDVQAYYDYIEESDKGAYECIENSAVFPSGYEEIIEKANEALVNFFRTEYSISVKEKIDNIRIRVFESNKIFDTQGFYGYFYPNDTYTVKKIPREEINRTIFLNSNLLFSEGIDTYIFKKNLSAVYVHETIHYLGFLSNDYKLSLIVEGLTDALTKDVMEFMGYADYSYGYPANSNIANQIRQVNEEIVQEILNIGNSGEIGGYILQEKFEEKLGKEQTSEMLDILNILEENYTYTGNREVIKIAQHLTAEYCKTFELTDEQILDIYDYFLVPIQDI